MVERTGRVERNERTIRAADDRTDGQSRQQWKHGVDGWLAWTGWQLDGRTICHPRVRHKAVCLASLFVPCTSCCDSTYRSSPIIKTSKSTEIASESANKLRAPVQLTVDSVKGEWTSGQDGTAVVLYGSCLRWGAGEMKQNTKPVFHIKCCPINNRVGWFINRTILYKTTNKHLATSEKAKYLRK